MPEVIKTYDKNETAKFLGISIRTLENLMKSKRIRATRVSPRKISFTVDSINAYIAKASR